MIAGQQFYPTPINVIKQMLEPYIKEKRYRNECNGSLENLVILEPSAGKGTILDYIKEVFSHSRTPSLYAIESDPDLLHILRDKDYKVIHDDFLTYSGDHFFDLIIMNPPFDTGDKHLLKAWNIMNEGDIVCLLNEETILNPYSETRKLLATIIKDNNGTVDYLGECFKYTKFDKFGLFDADEEDYKFKIEYNRMPEEQLIDDDIIIERQANVRVAMVRLHKTEIRKRFDFQFDNITAERKVNLTEDTIKDPIATKDVIGNIILQYGKTKDLFVDFLKALEGIRFYGTPLVDQYDDLCKMANKAWSDGGTKQIKYNTFVDDVRESTWKQIFRSTNFEKYMTHRLRQDFGKFSHSQGNMDITEENIWNLLAMLVENQGTIMENCITDVFDIFTQYHKDNRCHVEGWKTNDQFKVNKRIVLPYGVKYGEYSNSSDLKTYGSNFSINWDKQSEYSDIDKCLCFITGKSLDTIISINWAMKNKFRILDKIKTGDKFDNTCQSTFFNIKFWKKGTIHIEFRNEKLWEQFNIRACWKKQWLSPGKDFSGQNCTEQGIPMIESESPKQEVTKQLQGELF